MPGGSILIGKSRQEPAQEQPRNKEPAFDWSQPIQSLAKKGADETLAIKVGYKITYIGIDPKFLGAYGTEGVQFDSPIEQNGKTYNGTMTIKLAKIAGDNKHVDFKITLSSELDSEPVVWDSKELGTPASITHTGLQYEVVADKLYTTNDKFNGTMKNGETRTRDVLSGSGTISFYRIPGETPVEETGPVRTQGLRISAMPVGDNLRLSIEAPVGTPLDIRLYNNLGEMTQLGAIGMTTNQPKETLNYSLEDLPSGTYVVVVNSKHGTASMQIQLVK